MTDDTGLFQHAIFTVPNYVEGYTLDDNARGLIVAVMLEEEARAVETCSPSLQRKYLAFIRYCFDPKATQFHNFVGYDRRWLDALGSEDSHARALWALGAIVGRSLLKHIGPGIFRILVCRSPIVYIPALEDSG